ncbi:MAG: hypothetical protein O7B99_12165 [Planctomycetota bacterium]|nr:hypothetical protein [Planctomycetota bacterium]
MTSAAHDDPPTLDVAQAGAASGGPARWRVAFDVANRGAAPAALLAAWLPHGRFRCPEQRLADLVLPPDGTTQLAFDVAFDERPGAEVENCFVILRVRWREEAWRVMARLTVTAVEDGAPLAATQLVTAHRVGFSG